MLVEAVDHISRRRANGPPSLSCFANALQPPSGVGRRTERRAAGTRRGVRVCDTPMAACGDRCTSRCAFPRNLLAVAGRTGSASGNARARALAGTDGLPRPRCCPCAERHGHGHEEREERDEDRLMNRARKKSASSPSRLLLAPVAHARYRIAHRAVDDVQGVDGGPVRSSRSLWTVRPVRRGARPGQRGCLQPQTALLPTSVIVMWPMVVSALAPCQWRSPALIWATSPTVISDRACSVATMPDPEVTIRI